MIFTYNAPRLQLLGVLPSVFVCCAFYNFVFRNLFAVVVFFPFTIEITTSCVDLSRKKPKMFLPDGEIEPESAADRDCFAGVRHYNLTVLGSYSVVRRTYTDKPPISES